MASAHDGPDAATAQLWQRVRAAEARGALDACIADLHALKALTPRDPRVHGELGAVLGKRGDLRGAAEAFSVAVQLDRDNPRTWNNFGRALALIGERDAALRAFECAVRLAPDYALAHANYGSVLRDAGRVEEARAELDRALALDAALEPALMTLAAMATDRGDAEEASTLYTRVVDAAPRHVQAWQRLARARAELDDIDGARAAFAGATRADPGALAARVGAELALPHIYASLADLDARRQAYARGLDALEASLPAAAARLAYPQRVNALGWTNFLLAYQGLDDRALQERYGNLVARVLDAPPLAASPPPRTRPRIAFVSAFFRESTVGFYFSSWVTALDPRRFEVVVYHLGTAQDRVVAGLRASAALFRDCPHWPAHAVEQQLRADAPDVVVYPEVGMDTTTFVLAALRIAPVQAAGWGHPVTTGLPTIDAFLSCAAMEPDGAAAHYRERLVPLPGIGTSYALPNVPDDATRERFGLPGGVPLLLVPQSPFKIQPDDDERFARVLAAAPDARLVLFRGRNPRIDARYFTRLAAALDAHGVAARERVLVLPFMRHPDYLRVNTLCDAMLDTTRWSGGNTALDAIAAGLPIVTRPGVFMRARQTTGMYALMGLADHVAADDDDYVAKAVALAADRGRRAELSARLRDRHGAIFGDAAGPGALAERLAEWAERGTPLPGR
ncbi:MAG: hypothetical protein JSR18_14275 [Proteobacteria bacterium]|nr:hypothetical protein [Pseudomonadota bacterium]